MKVKILKNNFTLELILTPVNKRDKKILQEFCDNYGRLVILPKSPPSAESIENGEGVLFTIKLHPREVKMCDIFEYSGSGAC